MIDNIVDGMIRKKYIEATDREIYFCGLNTIVHTTIFVIFNLIFALITGWYLEILSVLLTFMVVRAYSGGYHANTYRKCLVLSVSLVITGVVVGKALLQFVYWKEITMLMYVISAVILLKEGVLPSLVRLHSKEYLLKKEKEYRILLSVFSVIFIFVFWKYGIQECIYISISMTIIVIALLYEKERRKHSDEKENS